MLSHTDDQADGEPMALWETELFYEKDHLQTIYEAVMEWPSLLPLTRRYLTRSLLFFIITLIKIMIKKNRAAASDDVIRMGGRHTVALVLYLVVLVTAFSKELSIVACFSFMHYEET